MAYISSTIDPSRINDFSYYSPRLLRIRDYESSSIVPFRMNKVQSYLDNIIDTHSRQHRVFIYILKARRTGISTYAEGKIFHKVHTQSDQRTAIIAHDFGGSENVYNMSRTYYDNLPAEWKPMSKYSTKKQLVLENPSKTGRLTNPGLKSRIDVFTAGRSIGVRGFDFNAVHLSEYAYFNDGAALMQSLNPTIADVPGNFMIIETTANGVDNFAYEEWKRYKEYYRKHGQNSQLIPIFIAWYDFEKYTKPFSNLQLQKAFESSLTKEDHEMIKHYRLTLEQMWWRQCTIDAMGGDLESFQCEYPSNDEEAFRTSGKPIFNLRKVVTADAGTRDPQFEGEIMSLTRMESVTGGRFKIWHMPQPGREYVMGVDTVVAEEANVPKIKTNADNAVICVLDKDTLVQVAEWSGRVDAMSLAPIAVDIAHLYNQALMVPEKNNSGQAFIYEVQKDYFNLYRMENFGRYGVKISDQLGWSTTTQTKDLLIDFAVFAFHNAYCKVNSASLIKEMRTFVNKSNGGKEAKSGYHDDHVMAWMLALFAAGRDRSTFVPHLQSAASEPKTRTLEDKFKDCNLGCMVDVDDWKAAHGHGQSDYYSNNMTWADY